LTEGVKDESSEENNSTPQRGRNRKQEKTAQWGAL